MKENIKSLMLAHDISLVSWNQAEEKEVVEFIPQKSFKHNWVELLDRFSRVFEGELSFNLNDDKITLRFPSERRFFALLKTVIETKEYAHCFCPGDGEVFDVKLGLSCNNNCVHCVVKPNIWDMKTCDPDSIILDSGFGMHCSHDLTYEQAIEVLKNHPVVSSYVLTGGEPTIRSDFLKILQWIYYNRPNSRVAIQTNGRNFADINFARAVTRYIRYPHAAIAVHGNEDTHNAIVNNRKDKGNPFQETMAGIRNLLRLFGTEGIRTEMVLSRRNMNDILDSVRFQYEELGVRVIGISYPHLCGFPKRLVEILAPTMSELLPMFIELNKYVLERPDLRIYIEAIPWCVFINHIKEEISLMTFEMTSMEYVKTSMLGDLKADFHALWVNEHSKPKQCSECIYDGTCVGLWQETAHLNEDVIKPVLASDPRIERYVERCKRRG